MSSIETIPITLADLGWQPFFQQQLTLDELGVLTPMRLVEQHRKEVELIGENGSFQIALLASMPQMVVGDWILIDSEGGFDRLLERSTCFRRIAAGHQKEEQLIAANIDTAFIVCSLNDDFNLNRIERYLALAHNAGVEPVVVLTKKDLCDDTESKLDSVQSLAPLLSVEVVNSLDSETKEQLAPWCNPGHTIVMLGSSGAGKSTLTNTLLGEEIQATQEIREDDSKGRHTTTSRSLIPMSGGAMLLDTPGMRELQLVDTEAGVAATFADIEELSTQCRFNDCQHQTEPGCAVQAAITAGELDERRLQNYEKLMREQAMNSASLAERRATDKNLGKFYKKVINESVRNKRGD